MCVIARQHSLAARKTEKIWLKMDPGNIELLVQLTLMSSGWVVEDRLKVGFSPYLLPDNCVYFAPPLSGRGSWSTFKADWNAFSKPAVSHIHSTAIFWQTEVSCCVYKVF